MILIARGNEKRRIGQSGQYCDSLNALKEIPSFIALDEKNYQPSKQAEKRN